MSLRLRGLIRDALLKPPLEGNIVLYGTMPITLSNFAAAISSNYQYMHVFGGVNGGGVYNTNYRWYNIAAKTWGAASASGAFTWSTGTYANSKFWAATGHDGAFRNRFFEFTPLTSTRTARDTVPGLARHSSRYVKMSENVLYLLGGFAGTTQKSVNTFCRYTISTNTWETLAPLPYSASGHCADAYNGKVYFWGGWSDDNAANHREIYEYTPETNTWRLIGLLPVANSWWGGLIYKGWIIQGAGRFGATGFYAIELKTLQWRHFNLNIPIRYAGEWLKDDSGLWLLGGCVSPPGATNYDNLTRYNQIYRIT